MIPLSGRVSRRPSGPSRSRDDDGGGLHYVFWKSVHPLRVFSSKGIYRQRRDVRRWTRQSHHLVARPGGGPCHPMVRLPLGPSPSLLWTPSSCQVNRNFDFVSSNSKNISCVTFLKHGNSKKRELALWHLVNRLVPENA
jgi:hypothetical protein